MMTGDSMYVFLLEYKSLPDIKKGIKEGHFGALECLRLNNNSIDRLVVCSSILGWAIFLTKMRKSKSAQLQMFPYAKRMTFAKFQNFPPLHGHPGAFLVKY